MTHSLLIAVAACGLMAAAASVANAQAAATRPAPAAPSAAAGNEIIVRAEGRTPPGTEVRGQAVSYADLNLHSDHGARTLLNRINTAARQVCSPQPRGGLSDRTNYNTCVHNATLHAVQSVNAPTLELAYKKRFGSSASPH
jgi:UrcA family protein